MRDVGFFTDHPTPTPARITDPQQALAARAQARLVTARLARDATDLHELLDTLGLWPAQDTAAIRELLVERR